MKKDEIDYITKVLDLLYTACIMEGGDGDALWYSKHYSIDDLLPIVKEFNNKLSHPFEIIIMNDKTILWGKNQEWITITTDKEEYLSVSSWINLILWN